MSKLPMWKKIAYGSGAGGGNVMSTFLASFLMAYYTDTVLIGAAAIGTMFLIIRAFDGITDLLMGAALDKTNTKLGKARPWIIISAPLMCIGIILIVNVPGGWDGAMKLVYAYITYFLINCIAYTMFAIAHMALLARISLDAKDRNTTSAVTAIINNVVGIVVGTLAAMLVVNLGWRLTGIILGTLSGGLILITGLLVKETVGMTETGIDKAVIVPLEKQFKALLKNKYFFLSLILGMLVLLMNANAIGAQTFYCNVVLQEPMFMAQLMSIGLAPSVLVLFFMPFFANKFSKRALMIISCIILIIGFIVLGIAGRNHALLILGTMIKALGIGSMFASLYAFVADAIDYGQWKTGIRSEGITAAASSIGAKLGMGFGAAITGWVLSAVGYNPAEAPSAAVISGITFDFSWLGVIISALLLICTLFMDVEKYLPEIHLAFEKSQASKLTDADEE